jgi:hypothetical protein
MDSNRDDAQICLDRAHEAIPSNLPRARRLLEKSRRMYPHPPLSMAQARCASAIRAAEPVAPRGPPVPPPKRDATPEMKAVVQRVQTAAAKGHYAVLGVEQGASDAEIKKAFRRLALALHPDKNVAAGAEVCCWLCLALGETARRSAPVKLSLSDWAVPACLPSSCLSPADRTHLRRCPERARCSQILCGEGRTINLGWTISRTRAWEVAVRSAARRGRAGRAGTHGGGERAEVALDSRCGEVKTVRGRLRRSWTTCSTA